MLNVSEVTKRYATKLAVDRVSFDVTEGRIFGLLGPNGAGKTSTIRMIAYITIPDDGRITFQGKPVGPWSQRVMGYLPEERGLYKKMRVKDHLEYLAELKGMRRRDAEKAVQYWLDRFEIASWAGKKIEELSKGMQQKVQFVGTIAHRPQLLIFDEPFSGLDPVNTRLLKDLILEQKARGATVVLSTHRMDQVEQMCESICLIHQGKAVLTGALDEIKASYGKSTIRLDYDGEVDSLSSLSGVREVRDSGRSANLLMEPDTDHQMVLRQLLDRVTVRAFSSTR